LCSDGLYRGLGEAEIAAALEDNPNAACERLVERVLAEQLDHQDNVTVMAWQCGSEALASTPRPRVSKRLLLAAASLVAALALGAGWWWWKHRTSEKPQPNGQQTATQPQNNAGAPGEDKAGKNGSGRSGESKTQGGKKQNKKQNKKKQSQSASGNEQQRSAPARGGNEN